MMEWTRRGFVGGWAAGLWARERRLSAERRLERVRLESGRPWRELEEAWARLGLGMPVRVVARACPGWWAAGRLLPDRWEAWVEFEDGRVLVAECRPQERVREAGPRWGFAGGEAVAAALRG